MSVKHTLPVYAEIDVLRKIIITLMTINRPPPKV